MTDSRDLIQRLKQERDRFVSFAFASADLLLEIDDAGRIAFATGAARGLTGRNAEDLIGQPLETLLVDADRRMLAECLHHCGEQGRIEPVVVRLSLPGGAETRVTVAASRIPAQSSVVHLAVSAAPLGAQQLPDGARDPASGLLKTEAFTAAARELIRGRGGAEPSYGMTLLDASSLTAHPGGDAIVAEIGATLRACSVGGDGAGDLGQGRFGVIHGAALDAAGIERRVADVARAAQPGRDVPPIKAATVALDTASMSAEDIGRALVYAINKFAQTAGQNFTIGSLTGGYQAMLSDTVEQIGAFRDLVANGDFRMVFQPIVNLRDDSVHHYEMLARIQKDGQMVSPFTFVTFAESLGLISEFDLAVARRAVDYLTYNAGRDDVAPIAINISGRSLGNDAFRIALEKLLSRHGRVRGRLMFEVTESSEISDLAGANAILQNLRQAGHAVCIDDFGAGSAALHYLKALAVDFVKIDGSYVQDATRSQYGWAFLRAMNGLCRDLGIRVIAEMVETEATVEMLRGIGIDLCQGYYYGRPAAVPTRPTHHAPRPRATA